MDITHMRTLALGRLSHSVTNLFQALNQTPVGLTWKISRLISFVCATDVLITASSEERVGCSRKGRQGLALSCWRHPQCWKDSRVCSWTLLMGDGLWRASGWRFMGHGQGSWIMDEGLWFMGRVHGSWFMDPWQLCNRLCIAGASLTISLLSIKRDVSRIEGGDGDGGNIRWFKANCWHRFGPWQRSLASQIPLPSSRNFPGDAGLPPSHRIIKTHCSSEPALLRAAARTECLASLIICSKKQTTKPRFAHYIPLRI